MTKRTMKNPTPKGTTDRRQQPATENPPWYGKLPERWEARKLKFLFTLVKGLNITKENLTNKGIPCVSYGEIHSKYGFEVVPEKHKLPFVSKGFLTTNPKSLLKYGDFVFADTSEDVIGSGNFTHLNSNTPTFAGYHTIIARPKVVMNYRYLAYFFDSPTFRSQIQRQINGVKVYSITRSILHNVTVFLPPAEMQNQIVRYLDWKVSQINKLINAKRRQIELLKEKKQATINSVVTKGLNPDVAYKDSGVTDIGFMPVHWEVQAFSKLFVIKAGGDVKSALYSYEPTHEHCYPVFTNSIDKCAVYAYTKEPVFSAGSLTVTGRGAVGHAIYRETPFDAIIRLLVLTPKTAMTCEYFGYIINATLNFVMTTTAITQLSALQFARYKTCVPPVKEQQKIVDYLDAHCERIDRVISKLSEEISLFGEYRTRLISDVVTGKLDVRDVVVPEYEAVDNVSEYNV